MGFLDVQELAELTGRTPAAIYVERHRGQGIGALGVKVGRRLLWREADIHAWFDEQQAAQLERVAG